MSVENPLSHQRRLLGAMLSQVLKADGMLCPDAAPSGPELLLAGADYLRSKGLLVSGDGLENPEHHVSF